MTKCIWHDVQD